MDPSTGDIYGPLPVPSTARAGDDLEAKQLEELREQMLEAEPDTCRTEVAETDRALEHLRAGGRLVAVDEPVVQRLRLGDRELQRRRRRR